jgi:hypothetical protein
MRFRRHRDAGELTFDSITWSGVYSGQRWVRVATDSGFTFVCRRDAVVILVDDKP